MSSSAPKKLYVNKNSSKKIIKLKKINPDFNLVSLKARYRLKDFKRILPYKDYNDYFNKCKNMYSVGSAMNKQYSMSDLYSYEQISSEQANKSFQSINLKILKDKKKCKLSKKTIIQNQKIFARHQSRFNSTIQNNANYKNILNNNNKNFEENHKTQHVINPMYKTMSFYNNNREHYNQFIRMKHSNFRDNKTFSLNENNIKNHFFNNTINLERNNSLDNDKIQSKSLLYNKTPMLISQRYSSNVRFTKYGGIIKKSSIFRGISVKDMLPNKSVSLPFIVNEENNNNFIP